MTVDRFHVVIMLHCFIVGSAAQSVAEDADKRVDAVVEMNYYTDEQTANVVFDLGHAPRAKETSVKAVLDQASGADILVEAVVRDTGAAALRIPIGRLPIGEYPVTLTVMAGDDEVWRGIDMLVKRPPPAKGVHVVRVDRYRRILVIDGKPWFPLGVFGIFPEYLDEAAKAGFNVTQRWKGATTSHRYQRTQAWNDPENRAAVRDYLDHVHQAGMFAVETPVKLVEEGMYVKFRDKEFHAKSPIVNREITPGIVKNAHDHPAVIGYYNYDEPDNFYPDQPDHPKHLMMQKGVEQWYDTVHELDPYHPVMTLVAVDVSKVQDWKAWDVAMRDFYINTDEHMSKVYDTAVKSVDTAWQLRTPFVYTPLFEKSSGRNVPLSPEEQRAQTYLSIVADVKGLFYWDWPAAYSPNWEMLKQLAGEVQQLSPILLERTPSQHIIYANPETEKSVKVLVKNFGGKTYLVTVNAEPAPVAVTLKLPDVYHGRPSVLFENRAVDVGRGVLADRFEAYDRHIYVFDGISWKPDFELSLAVDVGKAAKDRDPQFTSRDANLIVNSSFEHDYARLPDWPYAWHPGDTVMESGVTSAKAAGRWAVVEDDSHHGRRSIRLIKSAPGIGNSDDAFNLATTPAIEQRVEFSAAGKYTFSAWMKGNKPVRTWMMVGWEKFVPIEVGTQWKRHEITVDRKSAGSSFVRIYLMQQGTLWVDAVQLNKGERSGVYTYVEPE